MIEVREHLAKKIRFLLGIAEKGGAGYPCPNLLALFYKVIALRIPFTGWGMKGSRRLGKG